MSNPLWLRGLQHTRFPCHSLSPRVCSNSRPLSRWCHPTISSSATPFSSFQYKIFHRGGEAWVAWRRTRKISPKGRGGQGNCRKKEEHERRWQMANTSVQSGDINFLWLSLRWEWGFVKEGNTKECSDCSTIALISHTSKVMLKILQARLQQYMNCELPDIQAGLGKGRQTRDQIANIRWIMEKAREFQKNIYFCFIDYAKDFVWITINCWKFFKR